MNPQDFTRLLGNCKQAVEAKMDMLLSGAPEDLRLLEQAMRYSALGGGKRLRAFLLMQSAQLAGADAANALYNAAILEMVHAYSLIHDDLPAMDDDTLRHGKPCLHLAFGEAIAILAGDSLLTYAFALLSAPESHRDNAVRLKLIAHLAQASGHCGMAGGQHLDMLGFTQKDTMQDTDFETICRLQSLKTGALFTAAAQMGALLGDASDEMLFALKLYAEKIGLGFQIYDDLLDVTGDENLMGKQTGKDKIQGKISFLNFMSPDEAHSYAHRLIEEAAAAIQTIHVTDAKKDARKALIALAYFVITRVE